MKLRWFWLTLVLIVVVGLVGNWWRGRDVERSQDSAILAAAQRYAVDPALVKAVVWQESRFKPRAKGRSGEIGLMQLMSPAAHEWAASEKIQFFKHEHLYDPEKNLRAGTWYLKRALDRYGNTDNPIPFALAEYNAGRSKVLKWNHDAGSTNSAVFIEQIGYPGSQKYVRSVIARYEHYKGQGFGGAR